MKVVNIVECKKWTSMDIVILILDICSPLVTIIFTCFIPKGRELDSDVRLSIISVGIFIPILLLQISITKGQNKNESDLQKVNNNINDLSEKVNHISPVLEQVFLSGNNRIQRFAYRRFGEVCKVIQFAVNNDSSGNLRPSEYYEELMYLVNLIRKDKMENRNSYSGEIWAMTGFAEGEWIAKDGYERLWLDKLREVADDGIKIRRLCLLPDSVCDAIIRESFVEPSEDMYSFREFVGLLKIYYGANAKKNVTEHYVARERDNPRLKEIKGFFAIKLNNGDLHILYGETIDSNGALTARVIFNPNEIQNVRDLFEQYAKPVYKLEIRLKEMVQSNGFIEYLQEHGIIL